MFTLSPRAATFSYVKKQQTAQQSGSRGRAHSSGFQRAIRGLQASTSDTSQSPVEERELQLSKDTL